MPTMTLGCFSDQMRASMDPMDSWLQQTAEADANAPAEAKPSK